MTIIHDECGNIFNAEMVLNDRSDKHGHRLLACELLKQRNEMYDMLDSVLSEMHSLINAANDQILSNVNSLAETPPDLHDGQTLHEIQLLLAKARGEKK